MKRKKPGVGLYTRDHFHYIYRFFPQISAFTNSSSVAKLPLRYKYRDIKIPAPSQIAQIFQANNCTADVLLSRKLLCAICWDEGEHSKRHKVCL